MGEGWTKYEEYVLNAIERIEARLEKIETNTLARLEAYKILLDQSQVDMSQVGSKANNISIIEINNKLVNIEKELTNLRAKTSISAVISAVVSGIIVAIASIIYLSRG